MKITFNTDSHFVIGGLHVRENKPCQDHAMDTSLDDGNIGIAVVSDGCSSGSYKDNDNKKVIHTDIGARVLTCSAIRAISQAHSSYRPYISDRTPIHLASKIGIYTEMSKLTLGLRYDDMLATCAYAVLYQNGGFIHILGDGCAAIKYRDGRVKIFSLEWQNNTPYYMAYQSAGIERFMQLHLAIEGGDKALAVTHSTLSSRDPYPIHKTEQIEYVSIEQAVTGYVIPISEGIMQDIEYIALFSDGVNDFHFPNTPSIEDPVIQSFMSFKNYNGEFVKRRMTAGLKALVKQGIVPNDDFSMAVIHFNHEQTETPEDAQ